jgi:anti-sigma-K factor RskA
MSEHPWRDMAAAYALDALDAEEAAFFEAHLAECDQCRAEVAELRELTGALAYAAPPVQPPARLRARILDEARGSQALPSRPPTPTLSPPAAPAASRPARSRTPGGWLPWLAAAASLVLALVAGASLLREREQRLALESDYRQAVEAAARSDSLLAHVLGPEVQTATLAATGEAPAMRLFWDRARGVMVLSARNLPPPAAGRTYQLWGIAEGEAPVSLGTFETDPTGQAVVSLPVPRELALAVSAVTDEPAGGSPQPTTTPFLVGEWTGTR